MEYHDGKMIKRLCGFAAKLGAIGAFILELLGSYSPKTAEARINHVWNYEKTAVVDTIVAADTADGSAANNFWSEGFEIGGYAQSCSFNAGIDGNSKAQRNAVNARITNVVLSVTEAKENISVFVEKNNLKPGTYTRQDFFNKVVETEGSVKAAYKWINEHFAVLPNGGTSGPIFDAMRWPYGKDGGNYLSNDGKKDAANELKRRDSEVMFKVYDNGYVDTSHVKPMLEEIADGVNTAKYGWRKLKNYEVADDTNDDFSNEDSDFFEDSMNEDGYLENESLENFNFNDDEYFNLETVVSEGSELGYGRVEQQMAGPDKKMPETKTGDDNYKIDDTYYETKANANAAKTNADEKKYEHIDDILPTVSKAVDKADKGCSAASVAEGLFLFANIALLGGFICAASKLNKKRKERIEKAAEDCKETDDMLNTAFNASDYAFGEELFANSLGLKYVKPQIIDMVYDKDQGVYVSKAN